MLISDSFLFAEAVDQVFLPRFEIGDGGGNGFATVEAVKEFIDEIFV